MADQDRLEQAPEDDPGKGPTIAPKLPRQSLAKSRRELTEEELNQSGVRLMLMDEVDRLDLEVSRLILFRERFHEADKRLAELQAKHKRNLGLEILYGVSLSLGVGMLMLAPALPSGAIRATDIAVGVVLTICGIAAKGIQR